MRIGQEQFGRVVLGGLIQGTPIFPPTVFGETLCLSVSDQVERLSISDQVENLSIAEFCTGNKQ